VDESTLVIEGILQENPDIVPRTYYYGDMEPLIEGNGWFAEVATGGNKDATVTQRSKVCVEPAKK
jgi:hypothetical protein